MADEKNTIDKQIVDPTNADQKIDNPDYVEPVAPKPAAAAEDDLNLTPDPKEEPKEIVVGKTGNDTIDAVGALLAERKVPNADKIIADYAESGEISLAATAELADSLGEATAKMVIDQLTKEASKLTQASTDARNETLEYANKLFGGEDADTTWTQIQAYVKDPESGFSDNDKTALAKMIRAGGYQAQLAFDKIAQVYNSDSNTSSSADLLQGDTHVQGSFKSISSKAYAAELKTLVDEHGYESPQVHALQQRRLQSRNNGVA